MGILSIFKSKPTPAPASALDVARAMFQLQKDEQQRVADERAKLHAELNKPPAKVYPEGPAWELIKIPGNPTKVHITDNSLRTFICTATGAGFVAYESLYQPNDTDIQKRMKDKISVYPLDGVVYSMDDLEGMDSDDFDAYPLPKEVYDQFVAAVKEEDARVAAEAKAAFQSGTVTYPQFVRALIDMKEGYLLAIGQGANIQACITVRAREEASMGGPYLSLKVKRGIIRAGRINYRTDDEYYNPFEGSKTLKELNCYDLNSESNADLKARLLARGQKHIELVKKPAYVSYTGNMRVPGFFGPRNISASGRMMVDLGALAIFNPNYNSVVGGASNFEESQSLLVESPSVTEDMIVTLPAVVYGFSLQAKTWGEFDIEAISAIQFAENAFQKLQLPVATKNLLSAMVENVSSTSADKADIIAGKGGGAVILLAGMPGLGKTLSAEVMAEKLKRPLYMVNIGELGTTPAHLEGALARILSTASAWNAILLIDEADIFLEARNEADISRNAMVAVFLRLLEYYTGILFLTTNRAANLDPAFYSRIHLALHYDSLPEDTRKAIWENLMEMRGIKGISAAVLAKANLNGRQIKNMVGNAMALAKFEAVNIAQRHFDEAISTIQNFEESVGVTTFDSHGKAVSSKDLPALSTAIPLPKPV